MPKKKPLDSHLYPRDPGSFRFDSTTPDGLYVYVRSARNGSVYGLPDGPHRHPKVLGGAREALYAGDLSIENGVVQDLTNLSGTFQFTDEEGLRRTREALLRQGLRLAPDALRFFPADGSPCYPLW